MMHRKLRLRFESAGSSILGAVPLSGWQKRSNTGGDPPSKLPSNSEKLPGNIVVVQLEVVAIPRKFGKKKKQLFWEGKRGRIDGMMKSKSDV